MFKARGRASIFSDLRSTDIYLLTIHNNNFIYSSRERKLNEQSQYELFDQ